MIDTHPDKSLNGRPVWVLTDGKMGDRAQCLGVAERLGMQIEERVVNPGRPWVWFLPRGPIPPSDYPARATSPINPPFPDMVIGSGRRVAAYLPILKDASQGQVFTVFLKDPRIGAECADFLWVPEHDRLRGETVMTTVTGPHRISPSVLVDARQRLRPEWAGLRAPRLGLILGNPTGHAAPSDADIQSVLADLEPVLAEAESVVVTPSRRTPPAMMQALSALLSEKPHWIWSGDGDNPYQQILAQSDLLVVSGDSHNMVSEVLVAEKPLFILRPRRETRKLGRFLEVLESQASDVLSGMGTGSSVFSSFPPLDATDAIAKAIEAAFFQTRSLADRDT